MAVHDTYQRFWTVLARVTCSTDVQEDRLVNAKTTDAIWTAVDSVLVGKVAIHPCSTSVGMAMSTSQRVKDPSVMSLVTVSGKSTAYDGFDTSACQHAKNEEPFHAHIATNESPEVALTLFLRLAIHCASDNASGTTVVGPVGQNRGAVDTVIAVPLAPTPGTSTVDEMEAEAATKHPAVRPET